MPCDFLFKCAADTYLLTYFLQQASLQVQTLSQVAIHTLKVIHTTVGCAIK